VDCSDGQYCNGAETCNEATDSCDPGTAIDCDNGLYCDGVEFCNEGTETVLRFVTRPPIPVTWAPRWFVTTASTATV
jgi:hypothetical protein